MDISSVLGIVAGFTWLAAGGMLFLAFMRSGRGQNVRASIMGLIGLAIVAALLTSLSAGLVFIQPEERGVVISAVSPRGYARRRSSRACTGSSRSPRRRPLPDLQADLHHVDRYQRRGGEGDDSMAARTAGRPGDLRRRLGHLRRSTRAEVVDVHIAWQDRYADDLVRAQSRGIIRDVVSQYRRGRDGQRQACRDDRTDHRHHDRASWTTTAWSWTISSCATSPSPGVRRLGRAEADRRAAGPAGALGGRAAQAEAEQARQTAQGEADAAVIAARAGGSTLIKPRRKPRRWLCWARCSKSIPS